MDAVVVPPPAWRESHRGVGWKGLRHTGLDAARRPRWFSPGLGGGASGTGLAGTGHLVCALVDGLTMPMLQCGVTLLQMTRRPRRGVPLSIASRSRTVRSAVRAAHLTWAQRLRWFPWRCETLGGLLAVALQAAASVLKAVEGNKRLRISIAISRNRAGTRATTSTDVLYAVMALSQLQATPSALSIAQCFRSRRVRITH